MLWVKGWIWKQRPTICFVDMGMNMVSVSINGHLDNTGYEPHNSLLD